MHARAVGVEYPGDLDVNIVLAIENSVSAQRFPSS
jgi:hypothetical protein